MKKTRYFLCKSNTYDLFKIQVNFSDNNIVSGIVASNLTHNGGFMCCNRGNIIEVSIMGLEIFTEKYGVFKIECECFHNVEPIY